MNVAVLERDLLKKTDDAAALLEKTMRECQAYEEKDKDDKVIVKGRLMSAQERKDVQEKLDAAKAIKVQLDAAKSEDGFAAELARITDGMAKSRIATPAQPNGSRGGIKSLGQQWIESVAFDFCRQGHHRRSSAWSTPGLEFEAFDGNGRPLYGATLTTDPASGGDLIIADYQAGIRPLLFKRLVIADLLASGTTGSNAVTYMKETTFTNAAATVAEGASKPESTLVFDQVTDLVQKIAHWLPVTEEMLEDVAQIRSYIDARLRLGVQLAEEDQLLNGNGTPPNIRGILARAGLTAAQARGADTNADAIFKQITTIATTVFVQPDGIVLNPANWQTVMLAKDANGQYYGPGPFAAPQMSNRLWGLPTVPTPTIASGTALVGDFGGSAQVFRKDGIRVEASNSHNDYFIKNLVAIRAEERLALAVYREAAFGTVTGLN
jgi:HK97 family phage major capsid protein